MLYSQRMTPLYQRQLGKSVAHTEIQYYLKKQISGLELEKTIGNRRADAVWEEKKIIFEIQLSPLTHEEAYQRSQDYTAAGYQVVWILHEKLFNQREISPAEKFLRASFPTYFTNGASIYDQIEVIEGKSRLYRSHPLPINIDSPCTPFLKLPHRGWTLQFTGDLHTWCAVYGIKAFNKIQKTYRTPSGFRWWLQWIGLRILEVVSRNPK